jgi:hypothetical protein
VIIDMQSLILLFQNPAVYRLTDVCRFLPPPRAQSRCDGWTGCCERYCEYDQRVPESGNESALDECTSHSLLPLSREV